jgi:hypothetical protein
LFVCLYIYLFIHYLVNTTGMHFTRICLFHRCVIHRLRRKFIHSLTELVRFASKKKICVISFTRFTFHRCLNSSACNFHPSSD